MGALVGLEIPKDKTLKYETEIKAGKFVVLMTGSDEELEKAQNILPQSEPKIDLALV